MWLTWQQPRALAIRPLHFQCCESHHTQVFVFQKYPLIVPTSLETRSVLLIFSNLKVATELLAFPGKYLLVDLNPSVLLSILKVHIYQLQLSILVSCP